jgi:hypothetical protein
MLIMLQESFSQLFKASAKICLSLDLHLTQLLDSSISLKREVSDLLSLIIPIHLAPLNALISPA